MEEIDLKKCSQLLEGKMIEIGEKVRKKRIKENVTQQTLAFYILKDKCVISNIERGACTNISLLTLIKIAEVFKMDLIDLFI